MVDIRSFNCYSLEITQIPNHDNLATRCLTEHGQTERCSIGGLWIYLQMLTREPNPFCRRTPFYTKKQAE